MAEEEKEAPKRRSLYKKAEPEKRAEKDAEPKSGDAKSKGHTEVKGEAKKTESLYEKHKKERDALRKSHEGERRDLHGNHRDEHRQMAARHEKAHTDLADRQEAEMAAQQGPGAGADAVDAAGAPPAAGV